VSAASNGGESSGHSCVVTLAGEVWCWGPNKERQAAASSSDSVRVTRVTKVGGGALTGAVEVAAGGSFSCALTDDGTGSDTSRRQWCWSRNDDGQLGNGTTSSSSAATLVTRPAAMEDAIDIASGTSHTCVATVDARTWCWGNGSSGRLGDGSTNRRTVPTPVSGT
jgi:alpha-tubulin suppressor-like RCC1 family protein